MSATDEITTKAEFQPEAQPAPQPMPPLTARRPPDARQLAFMAEKAKEKAAYDQEEEDMRLYIGPNVDKFLYRN